MRKLNAMLTPLILAALIVMLIASQMASADSSVNDTAEVTDVREQISKQSPDDIKVATASNVQAKLDKLSPQQGRRVAEAIKNGALFMQLYLFGLACDTTNPYWNEDMGDVVAMNGDDWNEEVCGKFEPQKVSGYGPISHATGLVCPRANLTDIQLGDGTVSLSYQTTRLGAVILGTEYEAFKSQDSGERVQISITVNADNRVYKVAQTDRNHVEEYRASLNSIKANVADTDEFLRHPVPIIGKTIASIEARNKRYKTLIKQIENQADIVCN